MKKKSKTGFWLGIAGSLTISMIANMHSSFAQSIASDASLNSGSTQNIAFCIPEPWGCQ